MTAKAAARMRAVASCRPTAAAAVGLRRSSAVQWWNRAVVNTELASAWRRSARILGGGVSESTVAARLAREG